MELPSELKMFQVPEPFPSAVNCHSCTGGGYQGLSSQLSSPPKAKKDLLSMLGQSTCLFCAGAPFRSFRNSETVSLVHDSLISIDSV